MKGYVALTDDDIDLLSKAIEVIDNLTPEFETICEYKRFRRIEYQVEVNTPLWYGARYRIKNELYNLISLLWQGKDVRLWLDSYNEIIKLSNGDNNAQPTVILNDGGWW